MNQRLGDCPFCLYHPSLRAYILKKNISLSQVMFLWGTPASPLGAEAGLGAAPFSLQPQCLCSSPYSSASFQLEAISVDHRFLFLMFLSFFFFLA